MILFLLLTIQPLDSILNQTELNTAQYGIYVLDLAKDRVVYARNSQKSLVPASNMKLITTAASLCYLGPDYKYKTRLGLHGKIQDNTLVGDIVIIGGGDPSFSFSDLEHFVAAVKQKNIKTITGDILVNEGYFQDISLHGNSFTSERLPTGWAWHYLDARYAAEISALSLNKNYVNVNMKSTEVGDSAAVCIEPMTEYVTLVNNMITKQGEDSIIIYRRPENNIIFVDGGIGLGHEKDIPVAVKDPAIFFGTFFKERLAQENIVLRGDIIKENSMPFFELSNPHGLVTIDSVFSPPLLDILKETNIESINLYAEILLKTLGAHIYGAGTFYHGVRMIKRFLNLCGADTNTVSIWDGSGLSRHNLVSVYQLALVLRYMYQSKFFAMFYDFLPSAGNGTLERRFEEFEGEMRAKTGSLHAVSSLSGYLKVADTDYCFSIIFNNFTCSREKIREIEEGIIMSLQTHLEEKATNK